jgi:hypothetical protein
MKAHSLLFIRLILLLAFIGLVAGFVMSQYEDVRSMVITICVSCIGLGG